MFWKSIHLIIGIFGMTVLKLILSPPYDWSFAIAFLMVYFWITQPIPIYLTALLPLIIGPMSGLITEAELATAYGNKMVFLFFGGFILALGIEKWKLHSLFAQNILAFFGHTPRRILLGFMVSTAFLSMWISNTATALMMLPMALAIINTIPRFRLKKRFSIALLLAIAFSANIGGIATLIGTPPNIQMAAILEQQFGTHISFFDWMLFAFPLMITLLITTYIVLCIVFLRNVAFQVEHYNIQGLNTNQIRVLLVFVSAVFLWTTRDVLNLFLPFQLNDMLIALVCAILLFIIPIKEQSKSLLVWKDMQRIPWGILFLFGGGLALATILANSGAVAEMVHQLQKMSALPFIVLLFIVCTITIFATELISNLALVSLLIPLMGEFCLAAELPIVAMSSAIALCASCAFMLPVATPPNAIVYSSNIIQVKTMAKIGLVLNILTVITVVLAVYYFT
jgi:sodium-dependent dicarboxylate transporter 2/3/5